MCAFTDSLDFPWTLFTIATESTVNVKLEFEQMQQHITFHTDSLWAAFNQKQPSNTKDIKYKDWTRACMQTSHLIDVFDGCVAKAELFLLSLTPEWFQHQKCDFQNLPDRVWEVLLFCESKIRKETQSNGRSQKKNRRKIVVLCWDFLVTPQSSKQHDIRAFSSQSTHSPFFSDLTQDDEVSFCLFSNIK